MQTMSDVILNLWNSNKIESRALVVLVGATNAFTTALAISTWTAAGTTGLPGSIRFYLVWTSFLVIASAAALTAFVVHLPLRTELAFGAVLAGLVACGQVLLTWAVQYGRALLPAAFTSVSVFAAFLVVTLHGSAAVLYVSRHNLLPTKFSEGPVVQQKSGESPAKEALPPA